VLLCLSNCMLCQCSVKPPAMHNVHKNWQWSLKMDSLLLDSGRKSANKRHCKSTIFSMYVKFAGCITNFHGSCLYISPTPSKFYSPPLKTYHPQRKVVFQPSSFRGYISVFGAVSVCTSIRVSLGEGPNSFCNLPSLKLTVRP